MQRRFPNLVLGRVLAAFQCSVLISVSAGLALAAPIAALIAPTTVLIASAGILVTSTVVLLRIPGVADLQDPPQIAPPRPART
jgi:hypothetical protein